MKNTELNALQDVRELTNETLDGVAGGRPCTNVGKSPSFPFGTIIEEPTTPYRTKFPLTIS